MLVIRQAQMDVFARLQLESFKLRATQYVQARYPEAVKAQGPETVDAWVSHGLGRCAQYGLEREGQVFEYLDWMYLNGRDFDEAPPLQALLSDPLRDGSLKVIEVNDALAAVEAG